MGGEDSTKLSSNFYIQDLTLVHISYAHTMNKETPTSFDLYNDLNILFQPTFNIRIYYPLLFKEQPVTLFYHSRTKVSLKKIDC